MKKGITTKTKQKQNQEENKMSAHLSKKMPNRSKIYLLLPTLLLQLTTQSASNQSPRNQQSPLIERLEPQRRRRLSIPFQGSTKHRTLLWQTSKATGAHTITVQVKQTLYLMIDGSGSTQISFTHPIYKTKQKVTCRSLTRSTTCLIWQIDSLNTFNRDFFQLTLNFTKADRQEYRAFSAYLYTHEFLLLEGNRHFINIANENFCSIFFSMKRQSTYFDRVHRFNLLIKEWVPFPDQKQILFAKIKKVDRRFLEDFQAKSGSRRRQREDFTQESNTLAVRNNLTVKFDHSSPEYCRSIECFYLLELAGMNINQHIIFLEVEKVGEGYRTFHPGSNPFPLRLRPQPEARLKKMVFEPPKSRLSKNFKNFMRKDIELLDYYEEGQSLRLEVSPIWSGTKIELIAKEPKSNNSQSFRLMTASGSPFQLFIYSEVTKFLHKSNIKLFLRVTSESISNSNLLIIDYGYDNQMLSGSLKAGIRYSALVVNRTSKNLMINMNNYDWGVKGGDIYLTSNNSDDFGIALASCELDITKPSCNLLKKKFEVSKIGLSDVDGFYRSTVYRGDENQVLGRLVKFKFLCQFKAMRKDKRDDLFVAKNDCRHTLLVDYNPKTKDNQEEEKKLLNNFVQSQEKNKDNSKNSDPKSKEKSHLAPLISHKNSPSARKGEPGGQTDSPKNSSSANPTFPKLIQFYLDFERISRYDEIGPNKFKIYKCVPNQVAVYKINLKGYQRDALEIFITTENCNATVLVSDCELADNEDSILKSTPDDVEFCQYRRKVMSYSRKGIVYDYITTLMKTQNRRRLQAIYIGIVSRSSCSVLIYPVSASSKTPKIDKNLKIKNFKNLGGINRVSEYKIDRESKNVIWMDPGVHTVDIEVTGIPENEYLLQSNFMPDNLKADWVLCEKGGIIAPLSRSESFKLDKISNQPNLTKSGRTVELVEKRCLKVTRTGLLNRFQMFMLTLKGKFHFPFFYNKNSRIVITADKPQSFIFRIRLGVELDLQLSIRSGVLCLIFYRKHNKEWVEYKSIDRDKGNYLIPISFEMIHDVCGITKNVKNHPKSDSCDIKLNLINRSNKTFETLHQDVRLDIELADQNLHRFEKDKSYEICFGGATNSEFNGLFELRIGFNEYYLHGLFFEIEFTQKFKLELFLDSLATKTKIPVSYYRYRSKSRYLIHIARRDLLKHQVEGAGAFFLIFKAKLERNFKLNFQRSGFSCPRLKFKLSSFVSHLSLDGFSFFKQTHMNVKASQSEFLVVGGYWKNQKLTPNFVVFENRQPFCIDFMTFDPKNFRVLSYDYQRCGRRLHVIISPEVLLIRFSKILEDSAIFFEVFDDSASFLQESSDKELGANGRFFTWETALDVHEDQGRTAGMVLLPQRNFKGFGYIVDTRDKEEISFHIIKNWKRGQRNEIKTTPQERSRNVSLDGESYKFIFIPQDIDSSYRFEVENTHQFRRTSYNTSVFNIINHLSPLKTDDLTKSAKSGVAFKDERVVLKISRNSRILILDERRIFWVPRLGEYELRLERGANLTLSYIIEGDLRQPNMRVYFSFRRSSIGSVLSNSPNQNKDLPRTNRSHLTYSISIGEESKTASITVKLKKTSKRLNFSVLMNKGIKHVIRPDEKIQFKINGGDRFEGVFQEKEHQRLTCKLGIQLDLPLTWISSRNRATKNGRNQAGQKSTKNENRKSYKTDRLNSRMFLKIQQNGTINQQGGRGNETIVHSIAETYWTREWEQALSQSGKKEIKFNVFHQKEPTSLEVKLSDWFWKKLSFTLICSARTLDSISRTTILRRNVKLQGESSFYVKLTTPKGEYRKPGIDIFPPDYNGLIWSPVHEAQHAEGPSNQVIYQITTKNSLKNQLPKSVHFDSLNRKESEEDESQANQAERERCVYLIIRTPISSVSNLYLRDYFFTYYYSSEVNEYHRDLSGISKSAKNAKKEKESQRKRDSRDDYDYRMAAHTAEYTNFKKLVDKYIGDGLAESPIEQRRVYHRAEVFSRNNRPSYRVLYSLFKPGSQIESDLPNIAQLEVTYTLYLGDNNFCMLQSQADSALKGRDLDLPPLASKTYTARRDKDGRLDYSNFTKNAYKKHRDAAFRYLSPQSEIAEVIYSPNVTIFKWNQKIHLNLIVKASIELQNGERIETLLSAYEAVLSSSIPTNLLILNILIAFLIIVGVFSVGYLVLRVARASWATGGGSQVRIENQRAGREWSGVRESTQTSDEGVDRVFEISRDFEEDSGEFEEESKEEEQD